MSELVGDGGDAGEAGETPEPPVGGVGATPGGRFADYTDAQVDAALAAEDEGSGAGRAPGTQAGGQERTGQEAGREAQAEQAGQEEEATGTGEGAVRPDDGGAAPGELGWAGGADVTGPHPGAAAGEARSEYDGDAAALLAEEDGLPESGPRPGQAPGSGPPQETGPGPGPDARQPPTEAPPIEAPPAEVPPVGHTDSAAGQEPRPDHDATAPGTGQPDAPYTRAAGPDNGHAAPDGVPDAGLPDAVADALWAKFEARMVQQDARHEADLQSLEAKYAAREKELTAEIQTLKDARQTAPEVQEHTGGKGEQPNAGNRERTIAQAETTEARDKSDRPGVWSNAKTALYGGIASVGAGFVFSEFYPDVPSSVVVVATGALSIASLFVPVLREGWKVKHDNPPDKP